MQQYKTIKTTAEMKMLVKEIIDNMEPKALEIYAKLKEQCEYRRIKSIEIIKDPGEEKRQKDFANKVYKQAYDELYKFEKNYGIYKIGLDFFRTQCMKANKSILMEPIDYKAKPKVTTNDEAGF